MSNTKTELEAFTRFADQQLAAGESDYDLSDLFELWQQTQAKPESHRENVSAVQAAIDDFDAGDRGKPAGELTEKLRQSIGSRRNES